MNNSLTHRGPDAGGYAELADGKACVGQRRLSIIDIDDRSNQPMWSADRKFVIVYNGEIYNYRELKAELKYLFSTDSDTEVLLAGLALNGSEWIKNCNGMFAYALYDTTDGSFTLCRDRLGIKPLYYYLDENYFVFSSEIKGILTSGLVKAEFNTDAVDEYLANRYIREPYTFFKNIYQLPSGSILKLDADMNISINKYWELPREFNMQENENEEEVYLRFKEQLINAIRRRMIADVPLGTYLSGGIDSSIISAVGALESEKRINTYTIGFPELNEFSYAKKVADKYNTIHHEIVVDNKGYFGKLRELISYKDAPLGVPNEVPLAIMSKELKKNITVVLSGEGADELMGGYGRIFRSPFDYAHIDKACGKDFYEYFIGLYEYVPRTLRDKYLKTGYSIRNEKDALIRSEFEKQSNEEAVFRFFHNYHVKGLLQRVDITTMYASVEARVPFLDHELIEFTYKYVPYEMKLKWNDAEAQILAATESSSAYSEVLDSPKYLVRRLGLALLPEDVVTRKKMGFPVPLNNWYEELTLMAKELLANSEWFESEKLENLLAECKTNARFGQILWMFVNVELFRRMYFEKDWRY